MNKKFKELTNKIAKWVVVVIILSGMISITGCYYDDEDTLYPQVGGCDTANVSYTGTIAGIMSNNCNSCHSGSAPQANIKTDNYTDLRSVAQDNGKLWGVVNHETGFSPMPKDRPKLSECDLNKIRIWINNGFTE